MGWIIGIGLVVIYLIYSFNKDYKENVQTNVTNVGGMKSKYSTLVEYLTNTNSSKITKLTQDSIIISSPTMTFYINYVGSNTEIDLVTIMPVVGKLSNNWKYPDNYPQDKIILDIENYLKWEISKITDIAESDTFKYIKDKD